MTKDIFLSSASLLRFSENSGELVSKSPTVSKVDFRTKCRKFQKRLPESEAFLPDKFL